MQHRPPFRRAAAVLALVALVAGCSGDDDAGDSDDSVSDVPTDEEASAPSSTTSVPADEGVDDPFVVIANLSSDEVVPRISVDVAHDARFEAMIAEPGRLCVALNTSQPGRTGVHLHVGAAGEEGDVYLDVGAALEPPAGDREDMATGCLDVDEETEAALANSTDAFYVDVHAEDHPDGALRGQLQGASIFDLQFLP